MSSSSDAPPGRTIPLRHLKVFTIDADPPHPILLQFPSGRHSFQSSTSLVGNPCFETTFQKDPPISATYLISPRSISSSIRDGGLCNLAGQAGVSVCLLSGERGDSSLDAKPRQNPPLPQPPDAFDGSETNGLGIQSSELKNARFSKPFPPRMTFERSS